MSSIPNSPISNFRCSASFSSFVSLCFAWLVCVRDADVAIRARRPPPRPSPLVPDIFPTRFVPNCHFDGMSEKVRYGDGDLYPTYSSPSRRFPQTMTIIIIM